MEHGNAETKWKQKEGASRKKAIGEKRRKKKKQKRTSMRIHNIMLLINIHGHAGRVVHHRVPVYALVRRALVHVGIRAALLPAVVDYRDVAAAHCAHAQDF